MMEIVTKGAKEQGYAPDFWITPNSVSNCGRPYPYMIFRNMEALKVSHVKHCVKWEIRYPISKKRYMQAYGQ